MEKADGRSIMFARMSYKPGSKEYEDYYSIYPEMKEEDDCIRQNGAITGPGRSTNDPVKTPFADAGFGLLYELQKLVDQQKPASKKVDIEGYDMSKVIQNRAKFLGAVDVGITSCKEEHFYSVVGRPLSKYGKLGDSNFKNAIVIAVEMKEACINRAPQLEELYAVTKGYMDAGIIALWISHYINQLGYKSQAHIDGNYELVAPLVARDAGLGEFGENGLIVHKTYGQRIRLSVVTTDLPLEHDSEKKFGLKELCNKCHICSDNCPAKAIDMKEGIVTHEKCFQLWQKIGTDCGICLSSCPLSQSGNIQEVNQFIDSFETYQKNPIDYNYEVYQKAISDLLVRHKERFGKRHYNKQPLECLL